MTISRTLATVALIGLVSVSTAACSQSRDTAEAADAAEAPTRGGDPAERIERQLASMRAAVGLSDAQAEEIRGILEAQAPPRPPRGAREDGARGQGNRGAMREAMQARRDEMHRQIEAVLRPDQVEAFREWTATQRQDRRGGRGGRRG